MRKTHRDILNECLNDYDFGPEDQCSHEACDLLVCCVNCANFLTDCKGGCGTIKQYRIMISEGELDWLDSPDYPRMMWQL